MVTIEEVAEYLADMNEMFELDPFDGGIAHYYAYLDEDGNLTHHKTDTWFSAKRDISEYINDETPERVYGTETLDDDTFYDMCFDLTELINDYLKEEGE